MASGEHDVLRIPTTRAHPIRVAGPAECGWEPPIEQESPRRERVLGDRFDGVGIVRAGDLDQDVAARPVERAVEFQRGFLHHLDEAEAETLEGHRFTELGVVKPA